MKKLYRTFICVLLSMCVLMQSLTVYATMGSSLKENVFTDTTGTDLANSETGDVNTNVKPSLGSGKMSYAYIMIYADIVYVPVTDSTNKELVGNELADAIVKMASSGQGVYSGSSKGQYQFKLRLGDNEANPQFWVEFNGNRLSDSSYIHRWAYAAMNNSLASYLENINVYLQLLSEINGQAANSLTTYINTRTVSEVPVLIYTVGAGDDYNSVGQSHQFTPADLASSWSSSVWTTPVNDCSTMVNNLNSNKCQWTSDTSHICCRWYYGAHSGRTAMPYHGYTNLIKSNYIPTSDGRAFYGRGYIFPGAGLGIVLLPDTTPGKYTFELKSDRVDWPASFKDGQSQTGNVIIGISTDDPTTLEKVENNARISKDKICYVVTVEGTGAYSECNEEDKNFDVGGPAFSTSRSRAIFDQTSIGQIFPHIVEFLPSQVIVHGEEGNDGGYPAKPNGFARNIYYLTGERMLQLMNDEWAITHGFRLEDPEDQTLQKLVRTMQYTVTVKELDTPVSYSQAKNATGVTTNARPADLPAFMANIGDDFFFNRIAKYPGSTTGYVMMSWLAPGASAFCYGFNMSTTTDPDAYAEIVANSISDQDWNVAQGIPSTENLSVAAGGQAFQIDLSGILHGIGGNPVSNTDPLVTAYNQDGQQNSQLPSAAISRTIEFNVVLTDSWGPTNDRCTLSCPGHSDDHSYSDEVSSSTGEAVKKKCKECGEEFSATGTPHMVPGPPDADGNPGPDVQEGWDTQTEKHSCSMEVTYYCHNDSYTVSSTMNGSDGKNPGTLINQQMYNGTAWVSSYGGTTITTPAVNTAELCEGYTQSRGCVSTHVTNCVHHITETHSFSIVESIDVYAYREITNAKVYALMGAKITEVDTSVVDSSAVGQSTSNAEARTTMWRAGGGYDGNNGRIWFTQFVDPGYKQWTSTTVTNKNGSAAYWLGNVVVTLTAPADSGVGDMANPSAIDKISRDVYTNYGQQKSRWKASGTDGTTTYQSGSASKGDMMSSTQSINEALQIVNSWQAANKSTSYKVMSIGDSLSITVGSYSQNVVAETLALDYGIPMFNYGFSDGVRTYYRNHRSRFINAQEAAIALRAGAFWDVYDDIQDLNNGTTMVTGYVGITSSNSSEKYKTIGNTRNNSNILTGALREPSSQLGSYSANGEVWSLGGISSFVADAYRVTASGKSTGLTEGRISNSGSVAQQSFDGYYTDFTYPNMGTFTVLGSANGAGVSSFIVNNNGAKNLSSYNCALAISNIKLIKTAPNGIYKSPIKASLMYSRIMDFSSGNTHSGCSGTTNALPGRDILVTCKYNPSSADNTLNDIVIHDPISVEYCQIIGNGYGDYDGPNGTVQDETKEDFRTITANMAEAEKPNYAVIGNTMHVWYSDFGDFYDNGGSWTPGSTSKSLGVGNTSQGANSNTGVVNGSAKGYTNNMNTSTWVKARYVSFDFPVSWYNKSGEYKVTPVGYWIDLSKVRTTKLPGSNSDFHAATSELQNAKADDAEFKYGMDFEFTILTSSSEDIAARAYFKTVAINDTDVTPTFNDEINTTRRDNLAANSVVQASKTMAVVGRIGNLALEDVGDFRFSNLFKQPYDNEWLIDGVIRKVNTYMPSKILATDFDILGSIRTPTGVNKTHSTLSVTNYSIGGLTDLGKAGNWLPLPLTSAYNPVPEYKTEQMRMGYGAYFDIETIGNYYGINSSKDANGNDVFYTGPTSRQDELKILEDGTTAQWDKVMNITPKYYLYDYSQNKFFAIDMYSGSMGDYTKFYSSTDAANQIKSVDTNLYIDLPTEDARRNVTTMEKEVTNMIVSNNGTNCAAYLDTDYIGTPMGITLDMKDLDYIGSSWLYGRVNSWDDFIGSNQLGDINSWKNIENNYDYVRAQDFAKQSQRWYFTLEVPSSTIITYPSAGSRTQTDIVNSHAKIKEDHPNSVIVCFGDITVTGDIYTLQYDAKNVNNGNNVTIKLFDEVKPDGWQPTWTNVITIGENTPVYGGDNGNTPVGTIDTKWPPLIVTDSFETSSSDLDTYGTH